MPGTRLKQKQIQTIITLDTLGVTQTIIAKKMGLSRQTIWTVVHNKNRYLKQTLDKQVKS